VILALSRVRLKIALAHALAIGYAVKSRVGMAPARPLSDYFAAGHNSR
jgi:hypothetical protein